MRNYAWMISLIGTIFAVIFLAVSWMGLYTDTVPKSWYVYYIIVVIVCVLITSFLYISNKSLNYIAFALSLVLLIAMAPTYPYGLLVTVPQLIASISIFK